MMMVTALGTVAKANFSKATMIKRDESKSDRISSELLQYYKKKKKYIAQSENNSLKINDELWEFVKFNRVTELAQFLLNSYLDFVESCQDYQKEYLNKFSSHLSEYLSVIDSENAIACLYEKLIEEKKINLKKKVIAKINELQLIDFEKILNLLKEQDFDNQKCGVQILKSEKISYEKVDLQLIDEIINQISITFGERGEKSIKKKALSSKEKEIWICECGKENDIDKIYCTDCKKDIYGFRKSEVKPIEIVEKLVDELDILKNTIR